MDSNSHPALLLVDGVSSIGALDFQFDEWRVDVAVTGSQKALSLPTGLAFLCVSPKVGRFALPRPRRLGLQAHGSWRTSHLPACPPGGCLPARDWMPTDPSTLCPTAVQALAAAKTATSRRCYYDFADMLRTNPTGNVPYTPILPLLYGMETSIGLLKEEGFENVVKRHHRWGGLCECPLPLALCILERAPAAGSLLTLSLPCAPFQAGRGHAEGRRGLGPADALPQPALEV
jgi:alanine-glyoxylate transaminase/serine-glyoxylate transaminase/serine-pyruvate transaminase